MKQPQNNMPALDTEGMGELEQGFDPALHHVTPSEAASPAEERELAGALTAMMDFAFSDEGLANISQVLQQDSRELFEKATDVAVPLLQKAHETLSEGSPAGKPESSVFFGDGGLIEQVTDIIFDIANQLGLPDAQNQDQYAATLMNIYKAAGQHIVDSGDQEAIAEAQNLAMDMALTSPDGSMSTPEQFRDPNSLSSSISEGLGTQPEGGLLNV